MKAKLSTGGDRDYIRLTAESISECVALQRIAVGVRKLLDSTQVQILTPGDELCLDITLRQNKKPTPEEQAKINAEHDSTE